jgi:hypothetical protein
MDVDLFIQALHEVSDKSFQPTSTDRLLDDLTITQEFLLKHPLLKTLIEFYLKKDNDSDSSLSFLNSLIDNIVHNLALPKNAYRYNERMQKFAMSLYILAGRNAYEFVRINIPGAIPAISTIQSLLNVEESQLMEGEFRFDALERKFSLNDTSIAFCSEDCTGVIPRVTYNAASNTFVGFSLPLSNGIPVSKSYQTESLAELEDWFCSMDKSTLLNVHMMQPITDIKKSFAPFILSAYGTNSKYTSLDIIRRWIWIFEQCLTKGIRILGFSTDGDSKYLKAMKLVLGYFASLPNMVLSDRADAFEVSIPVNWTWFYLRHRQLIFCFQDPTHICTKLRNRLLSSTATLVIGKQRISLDILSQMIANTSKLQHGLVKSDIYPNDRQNYASCEKISSDDVQSTLEEISDSQAIRLYLKLIRSVRIAYIDKTTNITDRMYHAWFSVFLCRMWWAWLLIQEKYDFYDILNGCLNNHAPSQNGKTSIKQFFITRTSFQSIEINAHQLTYIVLLVLEEKLPMEALQIFLFNSQTCESIFRSTRSMSGTFSSMVNFSVMQFLNRAQKLSILHAIKNENEHHSSAINSIPLLFPKHRKEASKSALSETVSGTWSLTKNNIQQIVSSAFDDAFELLSIVDVDDALIEEKIHTLKKLNTFVFDDMNATKKIIDESTLNDISSDSDSDSEPDDTSKYDYLIDDDDEEVGNYNDSIAYKLNDVSGDTFPGARIFDSIEQRKSSSYFKIQIDGKQKFMHKQTACWLFTDDKKSLSADRLRRVIQQNKDS